MALLPDGFLLLFATARTMVLLGGALAMKLIVVVIKVVMFDPTLAVLCF